MKLLGVEWKGKGNRQVLHFGIQIGRLDCLALRIMKLSREEFEQMYADFVAKRMFKTIPGGFAMKVDYEQAWKELRKELLDFDKMDMLQVMDRIQERNLYTPEAPEKVEKPEEPKAAEVGMPGWDADGKPHDAPVSQNPPEDTNGEKSIDPEHPDNKAPVITG